MKKKQDIMNTQVEERDACAIIAFVDKRGQSTHANIVQTIDALRKMGHRSGDINGDGDGCGITTDIPRDIWSGRLAKNGLSPHLAESNSFFVGHFLIPASVPSQSKKNILSRTRKLFSKNGADVLVEISGNTRDNELGPRARIAAPLFWQIGGMITDKSSNASRKRLFSLQLELERELPEMHIASLSLDSVVFKVQGVPDILPRVYPELREPDMSSVMTLGHGRYSTNTLPTVERSQPFSLLGHNGEINTINKLRSTGETLGIKPVAGGSDSQDLNRVIEGLINFYDLDILEAMEMVFPTIHSEVKNYNKELQEVYSLYRWFFPCSAQGPAAVLARSGDVCIGSVDALGLRPLWFGESDYNYFFSSEKGVVALERNMTDPRPLAPGEKVAISGSRGRPAEILNYGDIQKRIVKLFRNRPGTKKYLRTLHHGIPTTKIVSKKKESSLSGSFLEKTDTTARFNNPNYLGAFGWRQYDIFTRKRVAHTGREVIGSMGHTGPLASFVPESLPNISDYCKENVAVVTNPAIDREREAEHFTTRIVLGSRPDIHGQKSTPPLGLELKSPILVGANALAEFIDKQKCREICSKNSTYLIEDVIDFFYRSTKRPQTCPIFGRHLCS